MSWITKELSEVCEIKLGKTPSRSDKRFWDVEKISNNKWASIADLSKVKGRNIFETKEYISEKGAKLFNPVEANTILMSFKLSIGKLAITTEKIHTNEAIVALPIKIKDKISQEFLYYYLQFYDWDKESENDIKVKGKTLNKEKLKKIKVPIPSLPTQQKIVAKLDAIFAEIDVATAAAEANAKNAEALFQSYLTEVFERGGEGWERKTIEEITDKTKNVSPDKSPNIEFTYVDVSSISNTSYSIISTQKLLGKDAPSRAKKNIITNDILFATVRPTLKRIAIVPEFLENQVASTGYVVLRTNKKNYHKFLFYFLFTSTFNEAMESLQRGASYPAVTDSDVKLQKLLVPSYEEQYKISEKLEQINSSISIKINSELRKIEELKALKQAILQKAFSGELVKD